MKIRTAGFTLIELTMALAIAAIVLGIGVPGFQQIIRSNQLSSGANAIVTAVNLARSEAINRAARVTFCKSINLTSCRRGTDVGYEVGMLVFVDTDDDAQVDSGEQIVRAFAPMPNGMTAFGNGRVSNFISFLSDGTARMPNGNLILTGDGITVCRNSAARRISVNTIGRPRVGEGSC